MKKETSENHCSLSAEELDSFLDEALSLMAADPKLATDWEADFLKKQATDFKNGKSPSPKQQFHIKKARDEIAKRANRAGVSAAPPSALPETAPSLADEVENSLLFLGEEAELEDRLYWEIFLKPEAENPSESASKELRSFSEKLASLAAKKRQEAPPAYAPGAAS